MYLVSSVDAGHSVVGNFVTASDGPSMKRFICCVYDMPNTVVPPPKFRQHERKRVWRNRRDFPDIVSVECWISHVLTFIFSSVWFSANENRKHVTYALPEWHVMACTRQQCTDRISDRNPHAKKMSTKIKMLKPFMERFQTLVCVSSFPSTT